MEICSSSSLSSKAGEVHLSREADAGLGLAIEGRILTIEGVQGVQGIQGIQGILCSILAIEGGSQEQQSVKASAELPMRAIPGGVLYYVPY